MATQLLDGLRTDATRGMDAVLKAIIQAPKLSQYAQRVWRAEKKSGAVFTPTKICTPRRQCSPHSEPSAIGVLRGES
jgi:hypothetical protein